MKNFIFQIAIAITLLTLPACQKGLLVQETKPFAEQIPVNPHHPMKDSMDAILAKYIAKGLPGVEITVKNNDGWYATAGGYSQVEKRIPLLPGGKSWFFSISKTYTAALIMQLKEAGKIDLDAPITQYLPSEIMECIDKASQITVRMLLNHSSGIINLTELPEFMTGQLNHPLQQPSILQCARMLKGKPLMFAPGSDYSYSNSNYMLLQVVIERITGESYRQRLQEQIIQPLHLAHTYIELSEQQTIDLGFPNYYFDRYANEQLENCSRWNTAIASASGGYGGIAGSPADAIRFYEALLAGRVVSDASLAEMKQWFRGKASEQPDYGLGLEYFQYAPGSNPQFGHEGDGIGCSTQVFCVPDNNTILYININAGRHFFGPYLFKITDLKNELCRYVARWRP